MKEHFNLSAHDSDLGLRLGDVPALLREPGGFARLRAALGELRVAFPGDLDATEAPPWLVCPTLPRGSIAWQTGPGLRAHDGFAAHYGRLDEAARADLRRRYPEPSGWHGFYEGLRDASA